MRGLLTHTTFTVLLLALLWIQLIQLQAYGLLSSHDSTNGTVSSVVPPADDCRWSCGDAKFQYPFGVGKPSCFRNPDFKLICNETMHPPKLFLNDGISQVISDIATNDTQSLYQSSNLISINWNRTIPMKSGVKNYSMSWSPGPAFTVDGLELNITGCNFDTYLVDNNADLLLCQSTCTREHLSLSETMVLQNCGKGPGCCNFYLQDGHSIHLKFVRRSNGHSEMNTSPLWGNINVYTNYASLRWSIVDQSSCASAENMASYACKGSNSRCINDRFGYYCRCRQGYIGNPYNTSGCSPDHGYQPNPSENGCVYKCGNISFEFPFGLKEGCYAKEQFHLNCTKDGVLQLNNGDATVTEIDINEGIIKYKYSSDQLGYLYAMSSGESLYVRNAEVDSLEWAVANSTCDHAKRQPNYACQSDYHKCRNVTSAIEGHIGYRCMCVDGFHGNPYVKGGCKACHCKDNRGHCHHIRGLGRFNCDEQKIIMGIVIAVISGGFGLVFVSFGLIFLLRRRKSYIQKQERKKYFRQNHGLLLEQLISSDENASDKTKIFSIEELEKATNNFDATRILGRGGHGMVYKGILSDQRVVAIKKSKVIEDGEINQFINEVAILSQINHRNVVKLFGCCLETKVPLLVYDFIPNGSLYEILHANSNSGFSLSWDDCLRIAIETAGALHYLHSAASISVFHRDVKSSNILLDGNYTAKVSDFGASRLLPIDQTHVVTNVQGTFGYLDPEYYHTGQLNEKSDVYSFGVVLVELLLRKEPIFRSETGSKENLSNYFLWQTKRRPINEIVAAQVLEEATEEEIQSVAALAESCLRLRGEERPTMKQVEMTLQSLRMKRFNSHGRAFEENEEMEPLMSGRDKGDFHVLDIDSSDTANLSYQHSQRCDTIEQEYLSSVGLPR
ncbi:hypothetical protein ACP70R_043124 [Stipagrostis hirtigluma subsp. patula]